MTTTARPSYPARVAFPVAAAAPSAPPARVVVEHHRTPQVEWSVDLATGGHMLHLALAQCVFNNVLRLAGEQGVALADANVAVEGGFNADGTASTGIRCDIELAGPAPAPELAALAETAFAESTVVAVLRRAGSVELAGVHATERRSDVTSAGR